MSDVSLALNCDSAQLANGGAVAVNDALDLCFVINNCTAFKLQGSSNGGVDYADILGSGTTLGAGGTLTLSVTYLYSLIRCRFDHVKVVYSGTNPIVTVLRRWIRQSPIVGLDRTKQATLRDPILGTA